MASRLRPRTVSELVDVEFELLRRHYLSFLTIVAAALAPMTVLGFAALGVGAFALGRHSNGSGPTPAYWGIVIGVVVAVVATLLVLQAALIFAISDAYLEDRVDVPSAFRRAASNVGTTLGAYVLVTLLVLVGYVFLIIPGIYLWLALFTVPAIALLEDRGPGEAVSRSFALTKGRKLKALGALLVVGLISASISFTINIAGSLTGSVGFAAAAQLLSFVALYPITTIMAVLLYYDARIRAEGFDLERAAMALEATPPA